MGLDDIMRKDYQVRELSHGLTQVKDALNPENKKYVLLEASSNDSRTVVRVFDRDIKGWFKYARHYVLNLFNFDVKTYVKDDAANYLLVNMDKNIKEITSAFASSKKITKDFGERFELFSKVENDLRECLEVQKTFARHFKTSDQTQKTPEVFASDELLKEMNDVFNEPLTSWVFEIDTEKLEKEGRLKEGKLIDGTVPKKKVYESALTVYNRLVKNLRTIANNAPEEKDPSKKEEAIINALNALIDDRKNYNTHFETSVAKDIDDAIEAKLLELSAYISELESAQKTNDLQKIQGAYRNAHIFNHPKLKELYEKVSQMNESSLRIDQKPSFTKFRAAFENAQDILKTASVSVLVKMQTDINEDLVKMKALKEANHKIVVAEKHKLWLTNDTLQQIDDLGSSSLFDKKDVESAVAPKINLLKDLLNHYAKSDNDAAREALGERISKAMQDLGLLVTPEERAKGLWPVADLVGMCAKLQNEADVNIKRLESALDEMPDFSVPGLKIGPRNRLMTEKEQWMMLSAIATKAKKVVASMTNKAVGLSVKTLESQVEQDESWNRTIVDFERQIGILEGMKKSAEGIEKSAIDGRLTPEELDKAVLWAQGRLRT